MVLLVIWFISGVISILLAWRYKIPTMECFLALLLGPIFLIVFVGKRFVDFCERMDEKRGVEKEPDDELGDLY